MTTVRELYRKTGRDNKMFLTVYRIICDPLELVKLTLCSSPAGVEAVHENGNSVGEPGV